MKKLLLFGVLLAGISLSGCEFNKLAEEDSTDELMLVPKEPTTRQKAKTAAKQNPSPYSCLISTLADDEADYNYWNQAFWVHFPKPAIEQAEGKKIFKAFSYASEHAGAKAGSWGGKDNIVRVAQCVIPDSKLAETLLEEQLTKFGKNTWLESHKSGQSHSNNDEIKSKSITDWEWECVEYFITMVCQLNSEGEITNCIITDTKCVSYELEYYGPGEGGGGGGYPGDEPGECDPYGTEPCWQPPGGGSAPPPEPDPCEEDNPPAWCQPGNKCDTGDPIIDHTGVQETFEYLYDESDFDLPIDQRTEQGGFITKDPISGEMGFVEFPGSWPRFACGISTPANWLNAVPANTIAYVHTHPFFEGEDTTNPNVCGSKGDEEWESMASQADWEFLVDIANHLNDNTIKGYVIDGNNIVAFDYYSGLPIGNISTYDRCGF